MRDHHEEGARDRLIDTMLDEAMDRVSPPDLTARVARELDRPSTRIGPPPTTTRSGPRRRRIGFVATVAALAFLATLLWFAFRERPRFFRVEMSVLRGQVHVEGEHNDFTAGSGTVRYPALQTGDRIHSGESGSTLRLRPLGILDLKDHTTLEIESMTFGKRDGVLILSSATFGALAGAFTWNGLSGGSPIDAGETTQIRVADEGGRGASSLSATDLDLRKRIAELENDNSSLRTALRRKQLDELADAPKPTETEKPVRLGPTFENEEFSKVLKSVDWAVMGEAMQEMVPLIAERMKYDNVKDIPPEVLAKLLKLNSGLAEQAVKIMANVPGAGVNGSFTHPILAANEISATLHAAGLDLSDDQQAALDRVMQFHAAKDKSLRLSEDTREFKLESLIQEMDYKEQFYSEARNLLTPEQRAKLYDPTTQGRSGVDLFGTGVMLQEYARAIPANSARELSSRVSNNLASGLNLDPAARKQLDSVISDWAKSIPADYWKSGDGTEGKSSMRVSRIRAAAARQMELMRRIDREVKLSPAARRRWLKNMRIMVPLPK